MVKVTAVAVLIIVIVVVALVKVVKVEKNSSNGSIDSDCVGGGECRCSSNTISDSCGSCWK